MFACVKVEGPASKPWLSSYKIAALDSENMWFVRFSLVFISVVCLWRVHVPGIDRTRDYAAARQHKMLRASVSWTSQKTAEDAERKGIIYVITLHLTRD